MPRETHPAVLVGLETHDDAGAFQLSEDLAMVQTVDFFTPIVDDPYAYGQIAVANALSDIYAMGAMPTTALNIVGFPSDRLPMSVLSRILLGGFQKAHEAGVVILGGHSVKDPELKYGMAVTGLARPDELLTNAKARVGDLLVLTKPLGTGILTTALKNGKLPDAWLESATRTMAELNRTASVLMKRHHAHACTDVTGYGLLGHAYEMASGSGVTIRLNHQHLPVLDGVWELIERKQLTGGARDNERYVQPHLKLSESVSKPWWEVLLDPQTSGGLLIAFAPEDARAFLVDFEKETGTKLEPIGEVLPAQERALEVI